MEVEVYSGDIEAGIRQLKQKVNRDGILVEVKRRNEFANKTDRKKRKAVIAERRRLKRSQARNENLRNRRSAYDHIRNQDQTSGQFNLRRSLEANRSQ